VAGDPERLRVLRRHDLEPSVALERAGEVHRLAVELRE
jgi:hypothetical protein